MKTPMQYHRSDTAEFHEDGSLLGPVLVRILNTCGLRVLSGAYRQVLFRCHERMAAGGS